MNTPAPRDARTDEAQSARQIFRIPLVLGVATAVGLVSALIGDGVWDALSWLALSAPLAAMAWAWRVR